MAPRKWLTESSLPRQSSGERGAPSRPPREADIGRGHLPAAGSWRDGFFTLRWKMTVPLRAWPLSTWRGLFTWEPCISLRCGSQPKSKCPVEKLRTPSPLLKCPISFKNYGGLPATRSCFKHLGSVGEHAEQRSLPPGVDFLSERQTIHKKRYTVLEDNYYGGG